MARTPSNTDLPLGTVCPAFELPCVLCNRALGRDDIYAGPDDPLARRGLLVAFFSAHCPFVLHMQEAFTALMKEYAGQIATVCICSNDATQFPEDGPEGMRAQAAQLGWFTPQSSNDLRHPERSAAQPKDPLHPSATNFEDLSSRPAPEPVEGAVEGPASSASATEATEACTIPYLQDESQETAREFHAACTPDLYLFNTDRELVYHAQFDETRPYRQSDANAGVPRHPSIHQPAHGADLRKAIENLLAGNPPLQDQRPSLGCNIKWRD